jgi:hypothetical protein
MSRDVNAQVIEVRPWGGTRMTEITVLVKLDDAAGIEPRDGITLNVKEG